MTAIKIEQEITAYRVVTEDKSEVIADNQPLKLEDVPETRPDILYGTTYKIKPPTEDGAAIYITINDVIVNQGTPNEHKRPFEIFINSKNMDSFQWISAMTRLISSVFRKGGDVAFLIEELASVHQPNAGYFLKGKYYTSIVAHIASIIELHLTSIGMIKDPGLDENQKKFVEQKKQEFLEKHDKTGAGLNDEGWPESAVLCKKCNVKASIIMDGCLTCLNCGDSKCG